MIVVLVLLMAGLASCSITCPDGTKCSDKNTCCQTNKGYACCHYPSAVCCPDKSHCCPNGFTCNIETQMCEKKGLPWFRFPVSSTMPVNEPEERASLSQIPQEKSEETASPPIVHSDNATASVVHCDNYYTCPDGMTCCRSPYGQWFCCIYSMGQCCRDGIHCCPHGYTCDSTSTHCLRGKLTVPALPQIPAMSRNTPQISEEKAEETASPPIIHSDNVTASVVHCDNYNTCPDGTTCCRSPYGQWFCCIYSMGQCCRDGVHCCQHGYHCDSTSTQCLRETISLPSSSHIAAMPKNIPQDQCCLSDTGCCPIGFHCVEEYKVCVRDLNQAGSVMQLEEASNLNIEAGITPCDSTFHCPAEHTCCKTSTGEWACCPYHLGQCCADGKQCCEYGSDCDSTFTKCIKRYGNSLAPSKKKASIL